jgi:hypothetical protein
VALVKARQATATVWGYLRTQVRWRGLIPVVLFGLSILFTVHYYQAEQASQQRQAAQQAAAQRAEAAAFERKLCATLDRLASRKPPAGSPSDLSRAYLLWQWSQLAELGPDVGCGAAR